MWDPRLFVGHRAAAAHAVYAVQAGRGRAGRQVDAGAVREGADQRRGLRARGVRRAAHTLHGAGLNQNLWLTGRSCTCQSSPSCKELAHVDVKAREVSFKAAGMLD